MHGGVRYLEKAVFSLDYGQLKLVFEALHERKRLLENAPHLSNALPIMTVSKRLCVCSFDCWHHAGAHNACAHFQEQYFVAAMLPLVGGAVLLAWSKGNHFLCNTLAYFG